MEPSFLIGCDPEFRFRDRDASKLLIMNRNRGLKERFGLDGHPSTAEIRPAPQIEPRVLTEEIHRLLQAGVKQFPQTQHEYWLSGSCPDNEPIGGHIHYGVPMKDYYGDILDRLLAIPILLLENPKQAAYRRQRYGKLSDIRIQPYGIEYRTLPSWLVSKGVTLATLSLAKLIMQSLLSSQSKKIITETQKIPCDSVRFDICDKPFFLSHFDTIWKLIQSLPDYKKYCTDLALIPWMIKEKHQWNDTRNMLTAWRLEKTETETPPQQEKKIDLGSFITLSIPDKIQKINHWYDTQWASLYEAHSIKVNPNDLGYKQLRCYLQHVKWLFPITLVGAKKDRALNTFFLSRLFDRRDKITWAQKQLSNNVTIEFNQTHWSSETTAISRDLRKPDKLELTIHHILLFYATEIGLIQTPFNDQDRLPNIQRPATHEGESIVFNLNDYSSSLQDLRRENFSAPSYTTANSAVNITE